MQAEILRTDSTVSVIHQTTDLEKAKESLKIIEKEKELELLFSCHQSLNISSNFKSEIRPQVLSRKWNKFVETYPEEKWAVLQDISFTTSQFKDFIKENPSKCFENITNKDDFHYDVQNFIAQKIIEWKLAAPGSRFLDKRAMINCVETNQIRERRNIWHEAFSRVFKYQLKKKLFDDNGNLLPGIPKESSHLINEFKSGVLQFLNELAVKDHAEHMERLERCK